MHFWQSNFHSFSSLQKHSFLKANLVFKLMLHIKFSYFSLLSDLFLVKRLNCVKIFYDVKFIFYFWYIYQVDVVTHAGFFKKCDLEVVSWWLCFWWLGWCYGVWSSMCVRITFFVLCTLNYTNYFLYFPFLLQNA